MSKKVGSEKQILGGFKKIGGSRVDLCKHQQSVQKCKFSETNALKIWGLRSQNNIKSY